MCRIAYVPDTGTIDGRDLADLFSCLEHALGGDGNGLAFISDDTVHVAKSITLGTEFLADLAMQTSGPVLFHTRRATCGGVCDALCQPFVIDNKAFAHNGSWCGWNDVALELILRGDMDGSAPLNDSLTSAVIAAKHGRYTLETIKIGVFVIMTPGKTWLHLRGGQFRFCKSMGIYASEFPTDWPTSKPIGNDSIAMLSPDGPDFECGGYRKKTTVIWGKGAQGHIAGVPVSNDDDESDEEIPKENMLEGMDDEELIEYWEQRYGIQ